MPRVLQIVAGGGSQSDGDGGLATSARLPYPGDIAVAPDGTLYVAENAHDFNVVRLRRVSPDGVITTAAGSYDGGIGYSGDGGPATEAQFHGITGVDLGPDGSIYLADQSNFRVRRVDAAGTIMTVGGTGQYGANGDGGPAVQADLIPIDVAAAPDGSLYVAARDDLGSHRIRRISPEGVIYTVAGGGLSSDDGVLATDAFIYGISSVDVAPDGSIYFAENYLYHRIRRVGVDGRVTTIGGGLGQGFSGDGGPAAVAFLSNPFQLAVARDGSVYFADAANDRVRRIASDGIISTVAGGGNVTEVDGPAIGAYLGIPYGVAVGQEGEILVAENFNWQVRRIAVPFDGVTGERRLIASADGNEVFEFDTRGRHRFTYNALTGQVLLSFGYEGARLATISDGDGNITSISYGANSAVIEAPFHQQTTLTFDANGYLASVTNPAGETVELTHDADGLLQTFEDARHHAWQFTYDGAGRLERNDDPAGGFQTLARTSIPYGYQVTRMTAEGRNTAYAVERLPGGERVRRVTAPDGSVSETISGPDGQRLQTLADETERQLREGPDPRFGLQAPIAVETQETSPLGRLRSTSAVRQVILDNPFDPLSLLTQTDWLTINGRIPIVTEFTAGTPALQTTTTSMGRVIVEDLDGQGRLTKRSLTGLHAIRYSYDGRGRLSAITHGPDPDPNGEARITTFAYKETVDPYDPQNGYLDVVTDAEGRTVEFAYDGAGRPLMQTFQAGTAHERVVAYDYDDNGNLTGVTPPGRPRHDFTYTPVNLEEAYTPPLLPSVPQPQTSYGYDLDRNLTSVLHPGGGSVAYTLDPDSGQLDPLVIQPENETRGYTYDPTSGYTASVSTPDALLAFGYDGDLFTRETWSFAAPAVTHTVTHGYDNDFRRQSIQVDALPAVSFLYDDDGLLIAAGDLTLDRDAGNGLLRGTTLVGGVTITDTYTPSPFGEVDAYSAAVDDTPIYGYTIDQRDRLGRIVRKTETIEGASTQYEYGYDAAGRLADVWRLSPSPTHLAHYDYDANGNRIAGFNQVSGTIVPASGTDGTRYDDQDRLEQYETTAGGVVTYGYTDDGALQTKADLGATTTYSYDAFGNLRTVELPGGTTLTYLVDGRNRRIGKRVHAGVQEQFVHGFLYQDQLEPVAELGPDGGVVAQFVYASKPHVPDYVIKYGAAAGVYRIVSDHLGSPRLVVDLATGAIAQRIDYDEFGNVVEDTNPGFQPFGFVAGLMDSHFVGSDGALLLRLGARDYEPVTGRWADKDPVEFAGGELNFYSYASADPVNAVDINGLQTTRSDINYIIQSAVRGSVDDVIQGINYLGHGMKAQTALLTSVTNEKLRNVIGRLFQNGDTSLGGTAGRLLEEIRKGSCKHLEKAQGYSKHLEKILRGDLGQLSEIERGIAQALKIHLDHAITTARAAGMAP